MKVVTVETLLHVLGGEKNGNGILTPHPAIRRATAACASGPTRPTL